MKNLELELKEHIVIIEIPEGAEYQITSKIFALKLPSGNIQLLKKKLELICGKGELNEEIAYRFVKENSKHGTNTSFVNYKGGKSFFWAKESFISAVEASGFHWGKNPVEKPEPNDHNGSFFTMQVSFHQEVKYQEAEEKTFHPENCIICRVLE